MRWNASNTLLRTATAVLSTALASDVAAITSVKDASPIIARLLTSSSFFSAVGTRPRQLVIVVFYKLNRE